MKILEKLLGELAEFARQRMIPAVLITVLGLAAVRLALRMGAAALEKTRLEAGVRRLIRAAARVVLYLLLGLTVASAAGVDVTGIVALASVLTLAVSLSLQNALANVIGGFSLLYTKPFDLGDYVEVAEQFGQVREIGLTYTRLVTPDNKVISIPNSTVAAAQVVNHTAEGLRRVDVTVSVAFSVETRQVREALRRAADVPAVRQPPAPLAAVQGYTELGVTYLLQVWCAAQDYWTALYQVNGQIKTCLEAAGITAAAPIRNVFIQNFSGQE